MTVELLQTLSIVSFIAAGVLFLVGVALYFLLDVPRLYGDISGRSAKKAIEAIRKQNEETSAGGYRASTVNAVRGKITDQITNSGRLNIVTSDLPVTVGTSKMPKANETTVLAGNGGRKTAKAANETTVLAGNAPAYGAANETTVLGGNAPAYGAANETTVLGGSTPAYGAANETTVLGGNAPAYGAANETTVLGGAAPVYYGAPAGETASLGAQPSPVQAAPARPVSVGVFTIDIELSFMCATEIIG